MKQNRIKYRVGRQAHAFAEPQIVYTLYKILSALNISILFTFMHISLQKRP